VAEPVQTSIASNGRQPQLAAAAGADELRRTRGRIVYLLKTLGPCTAAQLSERLSMTTMGVRRHLSQLELEGLVRHSIEQQQRGRPTHRYSLTEEGDRLFPRHYDNLAQCLVDLIVELDGEDKLRQLFTLRMNRQLEIYRRRLGGLPLSERIQELARLRDEEGYMGSSEPQEDGSFLLIENNCALCDVALRCASVCESEMELFRGVLPETEIQRVRHIAEGDAICVYRIEPHP
jgi:predicted ArsR family transcriptional regulator